MSSSDAPPDLDHETWRLLEDKIFWDSKLLASVCAPRIRRDYERATREARANGASPKKAVGKKLNPDRVERDRKLPYLTKKDEEWLATFRPGGEKVTLAVQVRNVVVGIVAFAVVIWLIRLYTPRLGFDFARQIVIMAPILFPQLFAPYIKQWVVRNLGPTGTALLTPNALISLVLCYLLAIVSIWLPFTGVPQIVLVLVPLVTPGLLVLSAYYYFRMRRRILKNYREVWEILELPGLDEVHASPPYES